ncbi:MAG: BRO family protein [Candidatus Daviesbacteria bacterium]|nr:BRO family protein [Candidatus Daviesbacteria bacterium]
MIKTSISLFEGKKIRRHWNKKEEKWYFSIIDIIKILTGSTIPRRYWSDLKIKLKNEGSQVYEKIVQLKMQSSDGKYYLTDVTDVENLFRIIQSVPSPKAEPIKLWLARVGYERIQETADPEKSINRGRMNWQKMGRSEEWIQQRMMGQETRNKLTYYWKNNEVTEQDEYAILTNIIHQEWSELSVKEHKNLKKLKTENLRDHMSEAEIIFTALAELSTRQIAEVDQTKGFEENKIPARKGGKIARNARIELEQKTGKKVVSSKNFKLPTQIRSIKKSNE